MKKLFQPLQLEICYYDEKDVLTESFDEVVDENEGPIIPAIFFN